MVHGRLPQFKKELSEFSLFIQRLLLHLWARPTVDGSQVKRRESGDGDVAAHGCDQSGGVEGGLELSGLVACN